MAITFVNGSALIGTTEHSLPANAAYVELSTLQTDDCILQVWIDFSAIDVVTGTSDEFRLRIYEKVATVQRIVAEWVVRGPQSAPAFVTPTLIVGIGWDVTLVRTGVTSLTLPWSLRKIT